MCRAVNAALCGIEYMWGVDMILGAPPRPEYERRLGAALNAGAEWIIGAGAEWIIGADAPRENPPGIPPPPPPPPK
jgi:hypothetical protein